MVIIESKYIGQKHCVAVHTPSNSNLETDAPKDNQGLGATFSPTDLVATALGTCILTTLAIHAEKEEISLQGARAHIEKVMSPPPRRIASLNTIIYIPQNIPESFKVRLQDIADNCPVKLSLSKELFAPIKIEFI